MCDGQLRSWGTFKGSYIGFGVLRLPENRDTVLGLPIVRTIVYWGLDLGPLYGETSKKIGSGDN